MICKGVRKRYLHEPNPTKVEMKRECSCTKDGCLSLLWDLRS